MKAAYSGSRRIDAIAIPTSDRPRALARALRSILAHLQIHGRTPDITICDASTTPDHRQATFDCARRASRDYAGIVRCVGATEKKALAGQLARDSGVDRRVTDFCLFGLAPTRQAFGANRNCVLLTHGNRLLVSTDDDVVWRPAWPLYCADRYQFRSDTISRVIHANRDRAEAMAQLVPAHDCLLEYHDRVLGIEVAVKTLDQVATGNVAGRSMPGIEGLRSVPRKVRTSHSGVYGDSGMNSPFRAIFSPGALGLAELFSSSDAGRAAATSREVVASAAFPQVSRGGPWMAMACGLDNREPLPPYFPVGRNEDGLAGVIIRLCFPDACFAHLPLCVLHSPPERRQYAPDWVEALATPRLCDSVLCALATFGQPVLQEPRVMLGAHFQALARLPARELHALLGDLWREMVRARWIEVERLRALNKHAPDFWQDMLKQCAAALLACLQMSNAAADIERSVPGAVALPDIFLLYGQLLSSWNTLATVAAKKADHAHVFTVSPG